MKKSFESEMRKLNFLLTIQLILQFMLFLISACAVSLIVTAVISEATLIEVAEIIFHLINV